MKKISLVLVSVLAILASLALASAQQYNCPMGGFGNMMYGGYGYGGMLFSWLIGLLVVVALVLLIYWLIKQVSKKK